VSSRTLFKPYSVYLSITLEDLVTPIVVHGNIGHLNGESHTKLNSHYNQYIICLHYQNLGVSIHEICRVQHNFAVRKEREHFIAEFSECRVCCVLLHTSVRDFVLLIYLHFSKSERKSTAEGIKCLKAFINNRVSVA